MIQVISIRTADGEPVPDSTETFPDMETVRNELAVNADEDYAERVLSGLADASEVAIPNGRDVIDVWSVVS